MIDFIERNEYKQNQPMQFVGLLRSSSDGINKDQLLLSAADTSGAEADRSKVWSQLHNSGDPARSDSKDRTSSLLTLGGAQGIGSRQASV